jgi:hypothetical protein
MSITAKISKQNITTIIEALSELIADWNNIDAFERAPNNLTLCLLVGESGDGWIGEVWGKPASFIEQGQFTAPVELFEFLEQWLDDGNRETPIALSEVDLENIEHAIEAGDLTHAHVHSLIAEIRRLHAFHDEVTPDHITPESQLDDALASHDLHCPKCAAHLTSLGLCPTCGIRYAFAPEEIERLYADNDRLRQDRKDALSVISTDGMSVSEWVMRTGQAEHERQQLRDLIRDYALSTMPTDAFLHAALGEEEYQAIQAELAKVDLAEFAQRAALKTSRTD